MAKKVLVIDADEAAGRQIAEALAPLGVQIEVHKNAKEGLASLKAAAPDLVVMDLFLPGSDGFQVANEIRKSSAVPIVFASGVYKNPQVAKDVNVQFGAQLVTKPFAADAMRKAAAKPLGIAVEEDKKPDEVRRAPPAAVAAPTIGAISGTLRQRPLCTLLGDVYRGRGTGALELTKDKLRKKLYFQRGYVIFAVSNTRAENAGGMQVAQGQLQEAQLQAAIEHARSHQRALHDALVAVGALTPAQLQAALKRQTEEVVLSGCGLSDGSYAFAPLKEPLGVPDARHHPLALALVGVKRHFPIGAIREYLQSRAGLKAYRSPELDRELYTIKQIFPGEQVTPMLTVTGASVSEMLSRAKEAELPLLFGLLGFGLAAFQPLGGAGVPATTPGPSGGAAGTTPRLAGPAPSTLSPVPRAPAVPADPQTEAARDTVRAEHARVQNASHYQVLGVDPKASAEDIKKAYILAAKRWHSDSFGDVDLGDTRPLAETIFARLAEAHAALTDKGRREEYDIFLDRKAKGLPTDVGAIIAAEELYHKAVQLMRAGRWPDAEGQLQKAVKLNHAEAEFWANLAICAYRARGSAALGDARAAIAKARELIPELHVNDVAEAVLAAGEGELQKAERLLNRILLEKPDHPDALREIRAIRDRKEREAKPTGGLLGKFLSRK